MTSYNTSPYDFERLLHDAPNLRAYINGFSDDLREVLEKFDNRRAHFQNCRSH